MGEADPIGPPLTLEDLLFAVNQGAQDRARVKQSIPAHVKKGGHDSIKHSTPSQNSSLALTRGASFRVEQDT
jgi:hypothetical protein